MKRIAVCVLAVIGLLVCAGTGQADPIVVGNPPDGLNCFPFGCGSAGQPGRATRYQQVYSSAAFAGPILIGEIQFYQTPHTGGVLSTGAYHFYLSTTSRPVDGLDTTNFDANRGADHSRFAVVPFVGGTAPPVLSIVGSPFLYDPAAGNLLLDIVIPGGAIQLEGEDYAGFDARHGTAGGLFSRAHNFGEGTSGFGLVTGFVDAAAPIPEPASVLLTASGLAGLAVRRLRRCSRPRADG